MAPLTVCNIVYRKSSSLTQSLGCMIHRRKLQANVSSEEAPFQKILIANRGEIACRIIRTARKMGIKSVAVYSTADVTSKHVKMADEAVFIGPPPAQESYLNMQNILEAAINSQAEAVHPGYGFLSENPDFVKLLESKNVTFIGPSAETISEMGDKLKSKRLAVAAGVNTIPGYDGIITEEDECVKIAENIGYPVIIKPSGGGGGKGMRVARNEREIREGFKLSVQEARTSFGDERILIEKYLENARHIEVQILGDKHGNLVHLCERECSIQRRNQKVIEEAPSTAISDDIRKAITDQALSLCHRLGYYSAGTVEFLLDARGHFYFLEMNTRLQVEHPITECVTGVDLVWQMIRIAGGLPLDICQTDIRINGWAIESRIYAENPYKNFGLPSTGQLYAYKEPHFDGVRCDSGVEEGSSIGIYYDPMICKLICYGKNREEAIEKSTEALDSYAIYGVTTNIPLLRDILTEERFVKGDISTKYLPEVYKQGFQGRKLSEKDKKTLLAIAASIYGNVEERKRRILNVSNIKRQTHRSTNLVALFLNESIPITLESTPDNFRVKIRHDTYQLNKIDLSQTVLKITVSNEDIVAQIASKTENGVFEIILQGTTFTVKILPELAFNLLSKIPEIPKPNIDETIKAPMPGSIKSVSCKVGDRVVEGQELCVVEAMKMMNSMVSNMNGKIKRVNIQVEDTVSSGDILIELE